MGVEGCVQFSEMQPLEAVLITMCNAVAVD